MIGFVENTSGLYKQPLAVLLSTHQHNKLILTTPKPLPILHLSVQYSLSKEPQLCRIKYLALSILYRHLKHTPVRARRRSRSAGVQITDLEGQPIFTAFFV